jgi:hypothetical protein
MKYSKRSFAVVSVFLAVPVSFGIGTLYARRRRARRCYPSSRSGG